MIRRSQLRTWAGRKWWGSCQSSRGAVKGRGPLPVLLVRRLALDADVRVVDDTSPCDLYLCDSPVSGVL